MLIPLKDRISRADSEQHCGGPDEPPCMVWPSAASLGPGRLNKPHELKHSREETRLIPKPKGLSVPYDAVDDLKA